MFTFTLSPPETFWRSLIGATQPPHPGEPDEPEEKQPDQKKPEPMVIAPLSQY